MTWTIYDHVICADGATVSVQASEFAYCRPRTSDATAYTCVEAGFPSAPPPESWGKYCEDPSHPLDTVYAYLPVACVREFLTAHGGMVGGELPPGVLEDR